MKIGSSNIELKYNHKDGPLLFPIANYLVFNGVKTILGLTSCNLIINYSANIKESTINFFKSLDLPIFTIYGLTESTGILFTNLKNNLDLNSLGQPMQYSTFKFSNKDKINIGEISFIGRNRFMGYLDDDKPTLESLDSNGYMKTGDLGFINNSNNLIITGRNKETIKLVTGELIAPLPIEEEIKSHSTLISNVIIIGNFRKFLTCLITVKSDQEGNLANDIIDEVKELGFKSDTTFSLIKDKEAKKHFQTIIDYVNANNKTHYQKIRKFKIIPHDFTIESGELNDNYKLKRSLIIRNYSKEIDKMYLKPHF